ncbi:MAG: 3-deoxy-D-manno-octulosonic acid transferase [Pseudomonadota bacterium]
MAQPLARALLARRARRGKEDRSRLEERLGRPSLPRTEGELVWIHGASIGEATSALPLVHALGEARPGLRVLLTTGTRTAAEQIAPQLPACAIHQYVPVDTRQAVRGFLDHWRPDLALWVESELWPRLVVETSARGVPMAMINARLSAASTQRWQRAPRMAAALLSRFDQIIAQDQETVERVGQLGALAGCVSLGRNLKSAVLPVPPTPSALAEARDAIGGRPVWLAASTHEGEEAPLLAAHAALPEDTVLILVPRHPERGDAIAKEIAEAGLTVSRRRLGEVPDATTRVWLADTLGEMSLWYRLADVTFVGGSLVDKGGHTPFEPAALGNAILYGPSTENFAPAYAALDAAGGARQIAHATALATELGALLGDREARAAMAQAAAKVRAEMTPDLPALANDLLGLMDRRRNARA